MSATEPDQDSVGAILRAAREARDLSQAKVAEQLRLTPAAIAALEQDRFDELGPAVFARGHLRKYAILVGADPDMVLAAHGRRYSGPAESTLIPPASAHKPVGTGRRWRRPALAVVVILLLAALAAAGWWAWQQYAPVRQQEAVPTGIAPTRPVEPPSSPAEDEVAPMIEDVGPAAPGVDEEPAPEQTSSAADATSSVRPSAATGPAVAARSAAVDRSLRLVFSDACWLEVYDANGQRLAYDLVAAGETRSFPGPAPWRLVLGNARAVKLSLDGSELRLTDAFVVQNTASIRVSGSGSIERVELPARQVS